MVLHANALLAPVFGCLHWQGLGTLPSNQCCGRKSCEGRQAAPVVAGCGGSHVPSTNCRYPWSMVFAGLLWLSYGYQTDRQPASQAGRQAWREAARQADRQTQTDRPTGRQPRRWRGREGERERESARHVAPDRWHDARCRIPWKTMNPNNTKRSATGCHWLDTLLAIL